MSFRSPKRQSTIIESPIGELASLAKKRHMLDSVDDDALMEKLNHFIEIADPTDLAQVRILQDIFKTKISAMPRESVSQVNQRNQEVPYDLANMLAMSPDKKTKAIEMLREKRIAEEEAIRKTEQDRERQAGGADGEQ